MANPIIDALDEALERSSSNADRDLLQSVIELQQRRQYDDDSDRRIQEMEKLIFTWCGEMDDSLHED